MPERVFIGNLHRDTLRSHLRHMFEPFGNILDLTVKAGFGFVEFESSADATKAVSKCNGIELNGKRIVVEIAMKRRDNSRRDREKEGGYRLVVKNLHPTTTWQDLKDMMQSAGRVTFADTLKDLDEGIVEFARRDDMLYALRKYDDTKLNGQRVTLEEVGRRRGRSSRDRSPSRSVSRSRSPRRRSRSRSASGSRRRSRSPSPRRSRSRSSGSARSSHSRSPERARNGDAMNQTAPVEEY